MSTRFYDTDLTDAAWAFVAPVLPAARTGGRPRTTYAFQILQPVPLPPLLPADHARRTFNQVAKEYSENEAKQLLRKPSKQVPRQP